MLNDWRKHVFYADLRVVQMGCKESIRRTDCSSKCQSRVIQIYLPVMVVPGRVTHARLGLLGKADMATATACLHDQVVETVVGTHRICRASFRCLAGQVDADYHV